MEILHYKVIYRNGDRIPVLIADFYRNHDGSFVFEYCDQPKYEFPGFDFTKKRHVSDHLWEQISFRVPNNTRNQFPDVAPEELLKYTEGKLVTDHFEFQMDQNVPASAA